MDLSYITYIQYWNNYVIIMHDTDKINITYI